MNSFRFSATRNLLTILSAVAIFTYVSYQFRSFGRARLQERAHGLCCLLENADGPELLAQARLDLPLFAQRRSSELCHWWKGLVLPSVKLATELAAFWESTPLPEIKRTPANGVPCIVCPLNQRVC